MRTDKIRRRVAVILQLWQNFDRSVLRGISGYVQERAEWSVFVEEVEHQRIPDIEAWGADGLIVNFDNQEVAEQVNQLDIPIVGVGGGAGWYDPASGIPYIDTDGAQIGRLAAEHLLNCGLKNFAFCGYPKSRTNQWMLDRERGFVERLDEAGCDCHVFRGRYTSTVRWKDVLQELSDWLRTLPLPIGIMGCYDYRARHVLEVCQSLGLRVPDDVAVVGVDNDVVCELANPPLSSIEQGCFQIGYTAASSLDRLMAGEDSLPLRQSIEPVGLVSRQSTDVLCVEDALVAQALTEIRLQACHGVQASAVAEKFGVSRNTLDKRFKKVIGCTADLEIRRIRLEKAKELLSRTGLPLREIASEAGFANEQYLSTVFTKALECNPSEYRLKHRQSLHDKRQ